MAEIIKFLTAGNVDDGKSTLIGRLLYDTNSLFDDQIAEVRKTTDASFGGELDFSLFLDGLMSERTQKITIDVAYRYFSYKGKKFIIADAPGHEQYTRNMTVAASNSDIVIILIDATKGIKTQTTRHSYISHLFGIKKVIVAVNKMDLVDFSEEVFEKIKTEYLQKTADLGFDTIHFVPISAMLGENIVEKSKNVKWYQGKGIVEYLLDIGSVEELAVETPTRLQIQGLVKDGIKRYYQGALSSGKLAVNDEIIVYPAKKHAKITEIIHSQKSITQAQKSSSISVVLDREIDVDRGAIISELENKPYFSNYFGAYLVWFSEEDLDKNKEYLLKINHNYIRASLDTIDHLIDVNSLQKYKSQTLKQNQIGYVDVSLAQNIAFDSFFINKSSGAFLLIDKNTNETLGCGIIGEYSHDKKSAAKGSENEFLAELASVVKKHFGNEGYQAFVNSLKG